MKPKRKTPTPPKATKTIKVSQLAKRWRWKMAQVRDWLCEDRVAAFFRHDAIYATPTRGIAREQRTFHGLVRASTESIHALAASNYLEHIQIDDPNPLVVVRYRTDWPEGWYFSDLLVRATDIEAIEAAEEERRDPKTDASNDSSQEHEPSEPPNRQPDEHAPRSSALARASVRAVAALLWNLHPELNIEEMLARHELRTFGLRVGGHRDYTPETVRDWIHDLCPEPRAGRPRKRK